ncbi:MAG: 4-hydroxy-3-methylbut-2-enyl diphosphate reductase [Phycisphaerae bacterium]|nr:4-hydroxy-3-methylbut-2-enyl diphosphate reductase [Phycisphaerae bacterium]
MKLILANPRGFCAGVYMAIDVVDQLLDICPGEPIFVYHEIVHNTHVVGRFRDRGVQFVESIDEVPEGSTVVFSAHGVSPAVRKQARDRRLTAIDATCPLVTKVHAEAIRYSRKGFQILLVGHRNHQEVVGTRGEAPDAIQVVESPADIPSLRIDDPEKLIFLTQTTLSTDDAGVIIRALKAAFPSIKEPPASDICYATTNRQEAVRALGPKSDLVIVVGSRNSSNSVRLTEISENVGSRAILVDDASEMQDAWLDGVETVLLTAGASAPDDLIRGVIEWIAARHELTVEQHDVRHEDVEFGLPGTLKEIMRQRGIDPTGRRVVREDCGVRNASWFSGQAIPFTTVDLTIGASSGR